MIRSRKILIQSGWFGRKKIWGILLLIPLGFLSNADISAAASIAEASTGGTGTALTIGPPPLETEDVFVNFMNQKRGEPVNQLKLRYERIQKLIARKDIYRPKEITAFALTPREEFSRKPNRGLAYRHAALMIGYGVTMSGPHLMGRMTSALDVQPGEKVLEIGTGSGCQSAYLANLTDKVYTIEIIEPLAAETDKIYKDLVVRGYKEYEHINRKADDGYYGWAEHAPFDKIIVTCGIDHIPPPLLNQLKVGGTMCIPVGPPAAQTILKVTKRRDNEGNFIITREDIYKGRKKVTFVPFTKKGGGTYFK